MGVGYAHGRRAALSSSTRVYGARVGIAVDLPDSGPDSFEDAASDRRMMREDLRTFSGMETGRSPA
jgi:hypothetical protein